MLQMRNTALVVAVCLLGPLYSMSRLPQTTQGERQALAGGLRFTALPLPSGDLRGHKNVRPVHPRLAHLASWLSMAGAAIAVHDLDGDGLANDACHVDPRTDEVRVAPLPGTGARYEPQLLHPAPLPFDPITMAPMGCLPGDYNEDGQSDLLVYYWGRTPVLFLREGGRYRPTELVVPWQRWFTSAATLADFDGDGHLDIFLANYFPDGADILDPRGAGSPEMQRSWSQAQNGGRKHLLRFTADGYREDPEALPAEARTGWTLAVSAVDLDGDALPELYLANDFGPDRLLHNRSRAGTTHLALLVGEADFWAQRSHVLGRDSFKGMGVDFGDVDGDGRFDIFVGNIAVPFGLMENHLCFIQSGARERMQHGVAPFRERGEALGLSRGGWSWETRLADFDNDGTLEALQATGYLRGQHNRWPELQELALANDDLVHRPWAWPNLRPGDDISGDSRLRFYMRKGSERFVDVAQEVGVGLPQVSRGIATADIDGDGDLDFVVANQWETSYLFRNECHSCAPSLGLRLEVPLRGGATRPAVGAEVQVTRSDGRVLAAYVDGGGGHSGKRSPEVLLGLGNSPPGPVKTRVRWRDHEGRVHDQEFQLLPGRHTLLLGAP